MKRPERTDPRDGVRNAPLRGAVTAPAGPDGEGPAHGRAAPRPAPARSRPGTGYAPRSSPLNPGKPPGPFRLRIPIAYRISVLEQRGAGSDRPPPRPLPSGGGITHWTADTSSPPVGRGLSHWTADISSPPNGRGLRGGQSKSLPPLPVAKPALNLLWAMAKGTRGTASLPKKSDRVRSTRSPERTETARLRPPS